jgi:hypothetical protein
MAVPLVDVGSRCPRIRKVLCTWFQTLIDGQKIGAAAQRSTLNAVAFRRSLGERDLEQPIPIKRSVSFQGVAQRPFSLTLAIQHCHSSCRRTNEKRPAKRAVWN